MNQADTDGIVLFVSTGNMILVASRFAEDGTSNYPVVRTNQTHRKGRIESYKGAEYTWNLASAEDIRWPTSALSGTSCRSARRERYSVNHHPLNRRRSFEST